MAADVYTVQPPSAQRMDMVSGSAGWMYQVGLGEILGFKKRKQTYNRSLYSGGLAGFQIIYKSEILSIILKSRILKSAARCKA